MNNPLITVGISFYNNQDTLGDAINSVLNQSLTDWELILIDDGSTDDSLKIALQYSDDRIRLISDGENKNNTVRLNQIIMLATGKYLAVMDGDDIMHSERLAKQARVLNDNPQVDVVDTAMFSIDEKNHLVGERGRFKHGAFTLRSILLGKTIKHATVLGRLKWFRLHLYDAAFARAKDLELWCRTINKSVFVHIPQPLYYVREGDVSVKNYKASQKAARLIYRKYGPGVLSRPRVQLLILNSLLKGCVYTVAGWFGLQAKLTSSRNVKIPQQYLEEAEQMLKRAIAEPGAVSHD